MNKAVSLPRRYVLLYLSLAAAIIFTASIEVLAAVKDSARFLQWQAVGGVSGPEALDTYIALNLGAYFTKVLMPIVFSFYVYLAYRKFGVNVLFVFIWSVLGIGNLAYSLTNVAPLSGWFWCYCVLYACLVVGMVSLVGVIKESRK